MGEIDPAFIQPLEHRPNQITTKPKEIPTIDLSKQLDDLVKEVGSACKNWGFFQVINHGVPLEIRDKIFNASRKFFEQSLEEKNKVKRGEKQLVGYYDTELTKNIRDWKEVFDFYVEDPTLVPTSHELDDDRVTELYNQWPEYPSELREVSEEYAKEMEKLAYKLMGLIALSLGLKPDRFHGFFKDQTAFIRLNYYPPCSAPHLALGIGRHKDGGALTILAQDDVGGLEVKEKSGEWTLVTPTPNSYIINVGDVMQVWSNDACESVEHRVKVNSEKERFSIPYFFNPAHYVVLEPLEEIVNEENPPKYKPYNWGKFLFSRKRSNFQKLDAENLQIYHFKVSEESAEIF